MKITLSLAACLLVMAGCSGNSAQIKLNTAKANVKAKTLGAPTQGSGDARCNADVTGREVSEYDTSGDDIPDVRKVFMQLGDAANPRLVLICRESDVNSDGRKDVVRYYDDEGRSLREEADRNFDSKMDSITIYQNGSVVRQELDDNYDGKIDTKVFYEGGKPLRAERDIKGRSTATQWRPDRWEYFEGGRMVRMGTDLDGDARVDRWDRDGAWKKAQDAAAAQAEKDAAAGATTAPPKSDS
jgi:hypothetical protein